MYPGFFNCKTIYIRILLESLNADRVFKFINIDFYCFSIFVIRCDMMTGLDSDTRSLILESLMDFAEREMSEDFLLEIDAGGEFPKDLLKRIYDPQVLGLHLVLIPEEYGGFGGSTYDIYRLCERLARIDLGIATAIFATFLGSDPIRVGGTQEQKEKWLSMIAEEGLLVAYGATEPDAGSDLGAVNTKAEPVLENGEIKGYKLTGTKQWISNGGFADLYLILAKAPGGFSWFIMESGAEGLETGEPEDKHGIRAANTAAFSMNEVFVPLDHLVGLKEGTGLLEAQSVFGYTRLMVAAFGLGAGVECLERSVRYSQERIQKGSPLSEKLGYTHKLLVPHAVRLEASRAYIEEIASRLDGGEVGLQTEGAIAKYIATESGNDMAEAAIQALGGYGYTREYMVEKIKRDVRITMIYEGTNEIMEMTISRDRWQEHLKSRARYYLDLADDYDKLHSKHSDVGADLAALSLRALHNVIESCRLQRLTRNQHVFFELGRMISEAEVGMVFTKRCTLDDLGESVIYDKDTWKAMSRIYNRDAALKVILGGIQLVMAAGKADAPEMARTLGIEQALSLQSGLMDDMELVKNALMDKYKVKK